jgi:hypothetical protein
MKLSFVPALPAVLATLVVTGREISTDHGTAPATSPALPPVPLASEPLRPPANQIMQLAPGSTVRFSAGLDEVASVAAQGLRGSLSFDEQGTPRRLTLDIDLRHLAREDGTRARETAARVLGTYTDTAVSFSGARQNARQTRLPGVTDVTFGGTLQVGGVLNRVAVEARVSWGIEDEHAHLIARTTALGSQFGIAGMRAQVPFAREEPLTIVWNLVYEPAPR